MERNNTAFGKGNLDTLGHNGTGFSEQPVFTTPIGLSGTGADLNNESIWNWPTRKLLTQTIALKLVDEANRKGRDPKPYWTAYYCLCSATTTENKIFTNYCRSRVCTICMGIRKAELINRYLPVIKTWPQPYFVTLTIKAVPAKSLKKTIEKGMIRGLKLIIDKFRKRAERGKGKKLIAIRSLECNFNPIRRTYNPHFHLIVANKETAEILKREWLKLWTRKHAAPQCQDIRPVNDLEKDMIETIKYGMKLFTDPTMNKFRDKTVKPIIYISAIDNIVTAFKNKRLFDHFGFKVPAKPKEKIFRTVKEWENWLWSVHTKDWENLEDMNETLFRQDIDEDIRDILENNINTYLE
jgi:hypothetical protein